MHINFNNGSSIKPIQSKDNVKGKSSGSSRNILYHNGQCSCGNRLETMPEVFHGICNDCHIKLSGKQNDGSIVEY